MKESDSKQTPAEKPEVMPGMEGRMHPDGAFDDPIYEFWTKHGKSIIAGAVLAVLGTALVFGVRGYRSAQESAVQSAYTEAIAEDTLGAFAQDHQGHRLAGIAALQIANIAYEQGDWETAEAFYRIGVDSLSRTSLSGKARLGLAITLTKSGDDSSAEQILQALADDNREMVSTRAEALYQLSILYFANGRMDAFKTAAGQLSNLDPRSYWQDKLEFYRNHVDIPLASAEPAILQDFEESATESTVVPLTIEAAPATDTVEIPSEAVVE